MKLPRVLIAALLLAALGGTSAIGADPVKIGLITTLSGPGGYTGEDARDGFNLAVNEEGGKLGGVPVQVLVEDDGLKPATGREIADRFLQQDKVKLVTGIIFSNVMAAVVPDVVDAGAIYISSNAAPSIFAGKGCNKNLFVDSFQNDAANIPAAAYAEAQGYKKMILIASNYVAGKDMVTGFTSGYHGQTEDIFPSLTQSDFSAEIARIRDAKPDAIFYFLPGAGGINFLKQYAQAGLTKTIPVVTTEFSLDQRILAAVGDAADGITVTGHWNTDFPNAENKKFVAGFEAAYHRAPTFYAAQGYDTAHLIGSALRVVNGDVSKIDGLRAALRKADFHSVRGPFRFGPNQFPIQDWYQFKVERGTDGKLALKTKARVLKDFGDPFSAQCKL
ncbi:MAG: ABC transporter substrate-binding protein [Vulcanimicrobiaceae bacterium]